MNARVERAAKGTYTLIIIEFINVVLLSNALLVERSIEDFLRLNHALQLPLILFKQLI